MQTAIQAAVIARLVELGWRTRNTKIGWNDSTLEKEYPTAVGLKTAQVNFDSWNSAPDNYHLTGNYESEDRNCLSTIWVPIPKNSNVDQAADLAEKFVALADKAISQTYAANLYRLGHRPPAARPSSPLVCRICAKSLA